MPRPTVAASRRTATARRGGRRGDAGDALAARFDAPAPDRRGAAARRALRHEFVELPGLDGPRLLRAGAPRLSLRATAFASTRSTRCSAPSAWTAATTRACRTTTSGDTRNSCPTGSRAAARRRRASRRPLKPERGSAEPNPDFLSAERFIDDLLEPVGRVFRAHAGPFVLQFPPLLRRSGLDRACSSTAWIASSATCRATSSTRSKCATARSSAPTTRRCSRVTAPRTSTTRGRRCRCPAEQAAHVPLDAMPFVMVRLLLRPGATYEEQREAFAPFDRLGTRRTNDARAGGRPRRPRRRRAPSRPTCW